MELPGNEMKRCEVCGDDDLEFINGEVTCRMCGTQCTTQQTEVVLDETVQFRYLTQIGGPNQTALGSTIHEKKARTVPWKLSEAFQLIFFAQVRAIHSHLSLPKDYFQMAVQLWMRYLKATGEAFLNEEERLASKYPYGWGYIYDPAQGAEDRKRMVQRRRIYERKTVLNPQRQHDLLDSERALREMDFGDDDHPLSDSVSSSFSELDSSLDDSALLATIRASTPNSAVKPDRRHYWRGWCGEEVGRWFLLEYNLAVCFLPLLYLRPNGRPCGLADLLDLVRRHLVPFQNARLVLPASIVVRDKHMARCFQRVRAAPSRQRMVRVTRLLLDLLGMAVLPRFPLLSHIALRTGHLQLPEAVAALAQRLAQRWLTDTEAAPWVAGEATFKRNQPDCNAVCPDLVAMAFVVLVLFCLRGSDFAEAQRRHALVLFLREAAGRSDLFLWTEWAPRVAKMRRVGKSVSSIQDASGFVDLPNVGLLIQEDVADSPEPDDDDEDDEPSKLGRTGGRAIQAHEHLLMIQRASYVKDLMAPFQALIEGAVEQEEIAQMQEGEATFESNFKEHLLCYPVEPGTLEVLLKNTAVPSGSLSPDLYSQDAESVPEDPRATQIREALRELPSLQTLGSHVEQPLPEDPPGDFKEVVSLCAQCIAATSADLWMTTQSIQLSMRRISAVGNAKKKAALNRKSSVFPLRWRSMFNPD